MSEKETSLIAGCLAGNRTCQSDLYASLSPKMMVVCLRYSKNMEEAEEILQDGFIRVFKYIGQFKHEGSFEGWTRKIMVNCALQRLKTQANLRPIITLDTERDQYGNDEDITSRLTGKEMLQLVQNLSPAYRLVFNLYYFEGFKHREIAKLLGIEEGTSKSNLAQARRILQNAIKKNVTHEKKVLNG